MPAHELNFELYKKAYLIRMAEEKIREHYMEDEMKTPCHLYVGGEHIAAGVVHAMDDKDYVFGTYRSHGVYIAKTMETDKFFAELYGKATGVAKGKAGSMHLSAPEAGMLGSSAVVGTTIPVAVGCAFSQQYRDTGKMTAVFFGDGAIDEGVFWESINIASLKHLPILFVCEDNDLAIHTTAEERHGYRSIVEIVKQFNCHTYANESTDVEEVYNMTRTALEQCKQDNVPGFLYCKYYRYYEHVGINTDFHAGYRSEDIFEQWKEKDPIDVQRKKLIAAGYAEQSIIAFEEAVRRQLATSVTRAKQAPFADTNEVYTDVYA